jgi:radical SAM-linked protein
MQRAFLRAAVPLKYSEGFNPHALLSIALPLSVGHASVCELMDFRLGGETDLSELPARLSAVMPEGIKVTEVYEAERKIVELKWLRVEGRFEYDARDTDEMAAGVIDLFSRDMITVERRTKRGEGEFDIAPHIYSISVAPGEKTVNVETVISAQDPTINPELLISALRQNCPEYEPDFAFFTRLETYDEKMSAFR